MKTLHVTLEDRDYQRVIAAKKNKTWYEFILERCT
jgi:hypothetical protein